MRFESHKSRTSSSSYFELVFLDALEWFDCRSSAELSDMGSIRGVPAASAQFTVHSSDQSIWALGEKSP